MTVNGIISGRYLLLLLHCCKLTTLIAMQGHQNRSRSDNIKICYNNRTVINAILLYYFVLRLKRKGTKFSSGNYL